MFVGAQDGTADAALPPHARGQGVRAEGTSGRRKEILMMMMSIDTASPIAEAGTAADLTPEQQELRDRARRFVDEVLIPNEELAERSGGHIPDDLVERIKRESVDAGLS